MSESATAHQVFEALTLAKQQPAPQALPMLNGLIGLVQGAGSAPLEVEEARSSAFLAICEVGKALHRGQPTDDLYAKAIGATGQWVRLAT